MVKGKIGKNIERSQKYYETDFSCLLTEFQKWCAICASVCGVADMFAWVACLRVGMLACVVWVGLVACFRE